MPSDASSRSQSDEHASSIESLERYISPLYSYILRRVRQLEGKGVIYRGALSTPALVNMTILSALQNIQQRPLEVPFYSWLRHLARNIVEREVTRVQEEERHEASFDAPVPKRMRPLADQPLERFHLVDVLPDPKEPKPWTVLENRRLQDYFSCMLGELPDAWREPFLLSVVDDYPVEEIAEIEGTSVAKVNHAIELAREWILTKLAEEYEQQLPVRPWETLIRVAEEARIPDVYRSGLLEQLRSARQASEGLSEIP